QGSDDEQRFVVAGAVALVVLLVMDAGWRVERRRPNPLNLGFMAFLLFFAGAFVSEIGPWLRLGGALRETALPLFMAAAAVWAHVAWPGRAVHGKAALQADARRLAMTSWLVLAALPPAIAMSVVWRGDELLAAVAPVVGLYLWQAGLRQWLEKQAARDDGAAD
ncbi:MAG: hypothetical protein RLP96_00345, partial [Alphaproteobacteria bacterium]